MARLNAKLGSPFARPAAKAVPVRKGPAVWERLIRYLREVRMELGRVDWPSRPELIAMTTVVVVVLLVMAAFLGLVDLGLAWLFQQVLR